MTTQFLILRIQSIIDGNADMNPSQLRAIANEYKRVCEDAERKLVHCASLIKAGEGLCRFAGGGDGASFVGYNKRAAV